MMAVPQSFYAQMGYSVAKSISDMHNQLRDKKDQMWTYYHKPNVGGNYMDTRPAATMRQRSAQALQQHQLHGRTVLGQEGRLMHR